MPDVRIFGFEPVYRSDASVLILGSMPSVESLKQEFYYAHPRNCFWRMIAQLLKEDAPRTTPDKKAMLIRNRIALWDTVGSCVRPGSLDSSIREVWANDFDGIYGKCPNIRYVLFNGGTAYQLYKKYVGLSGERCYMRLPSTSPAYTLSYEKKLTAWRDAFREVELINESL